MGPSECNHIQQRHASNRPEIDPKGEEEEAAVVDAGPIRSCQGRATFSLTFTQGDATGVSLGLRRVARRGALWCYMRDNRWSYTHNTLSDTVLSVPLRVAKSR